MPRPPTRITGSFQRAQNSPPRCERNTKPPPVSFFLHPHLDIVEMAHQVPEYSLSSLLPFSLARFPIPFRIAYIYTSHKITPTTSFFSSFPSLLSRRLRTECRSSRCISDCGRSVTVTSNCRPRYQQRGLVHNRKRGKPRKF